MGGGGREGGKERLGKGGLGIITLCSFSNLRALVSVPKRIICR